MFNWLHLLWKMAWQQFLKMTQKRFKDNRPRCNEGCTLEYKTGSDDNYHGPQCHRQHYYLLDLHFILKEQSKILAILLKSRRSWKCRLALVNLTKVVPETENDRAWHCQLYKEALVCFGYCWLDGNNIKVGRKCGISKAAWPHRSEKEPLSLWDPPVYLSSESENICEIFWMVPKRSWEGFRSWNWAKILGNADADPE